MHQSTTFVTGGVCEPIRIGNQKVCGVATANVERPRFTVFKSSGSTNFYYLQVIQCRRFQIYNKSSKQT